MSTPVSPNEKTRRRIVEEIVRRTVSALTKLGWRAYTDNEGVHCMLEMGNIVFYPISSASPIDIAIGLARLDETVNNSAIECGIDLGPVVELVSGDQPHYIDNVINELKNQGCDNPEKSPNW